MCDVNWRNFVILHATLRAMNMTLTVIAGSALQVTFPVTSEVNCSVQACLASQIVLLREPKQQNNGI